MAQLHFYVPDHVEQELRRKAQAANLPVSRYLAELAKREVHSENRWPPGYAEEVLGQWDGDLERPPQGTPEERSGLD